MTNDTEKYRTSEKGIDVDGTYYAVYFLRELLGTIRTEATTGAFDMLRLWESEQLKEQERLKAYGENLSKQHEQNLITKDDG